MSNVCIDDISYDLRVCHLYKEVNVGDLRHDLALHLNHFFYFIHFFSCNRKFYFFSSKLA